MVDITVWVVGRVVLRPVTFWAGVGWAYDHGGVSRCGYMCVRVRVRESKCC